ncbi:hypothetical protein BTTOUR_00265 [Bacillus thuringiensis serovar toumanoffi]|uniref:HTH merR-type domain-containing protein n=1 Tax=Bacillus thuringiensis serovar toumanoffi TaxID=180862 RepID=A0ABD5HQP8_BACTU|nr:hypothetical protein [Bacillus thuringiensis serovar toumanoffi]
MEVLQREGFTVKKDNRGRRQYTDNDIMVIEKLIELSKYEARKGTEDDRAANREG